MGIYILPRTVCMESVGEWEQRYVGQNTVFVISWRGGPFHFLSSPSHLNPNSLNTRNFSANSLHFYLDFPALQNGKNEGSSLVCFNVRQYYN